MNKQSEYKFNLKKRKKTQAVQMLGGKCQICGYCKCNDALDFHHIGDDKEFNIGQAIPRWKWQRIVDELKKCVLLCSNCHRELHSKKSNDIDFKNLIKPWIKFKCPVCKIEFDTCNSNQIYCSMKCRAFSDRKVKIRPSKEELKQLLSNTSWTQIGKMFGVSDNAIRKWAKQYKLINAPEAQLDEQLLAKQTDG